jgi:hypothetical protein
MAGERLEIGRQGIAKLIKDGNLCVPPNQREYAWKDEHIVDLYQDIAKAIGDDEPDYFLGSVVVAKTNGSFQVFDGQQRIATTVILLAAIRDYCLSQNDGERTGIIERDYLMSRNLATLEPQPKLVLSKIDHDFYLKRVLDPDPAVRAAMVPTCESHERIQKATEIARQHVEAIVAPYPPAARSQRLTEWVNFLVERATVISVQVADDEALTLCSKR